MNWRLIIAICGAFLAVICYAQYKRINNLVLANSGLIDERNAAQLVLANQVRTTFIFNSVAEATLNEQIQNTLESQESQKIISDGIKDDKCTGGVVPNSAADVVLKRYDEVYREAISTHSSESN